MKKMFSFVTAMIMMICSLSCGIGFTAFAEDSAKTDTGNKLVAGNVNDVEFGAFSIELEGDSIKIFPNHFEYYTDYGGYVESGFYMDVASNDKFSIKSDSAFYRSSADNMRFTPESNGKYIVVICEFFSDYYTTFVSLDFYYIVPIICHNNIVDIDTDNIYTMCSGESNAHIVKTNKRIFRYQGGNYHIGIVLPKDKTIYSFKKFNDSWIEMDRLPVLVLSCFFEDHFFYNNELILLGKDKENEFYAEYNSSFIAKYDGILEERFGSVQAVFEKDLTAEGIETINGMKPASRIFCVYPGYIKENTVFLKDSNGITKYHIDTVAVKYTDSDGEENEYFELLPETFTSEKIDENDTNFNALVNMKNDRDLTPFSIKTEDDSIVITTFPFSASTNKKYVSELKVNIVSTEKVDYSYISDMSACSFVPKSNGKYVIFISEDFPDAPDKLTFYYAIPIICHNDTVNIDTDNIYTIYSNLTDTYIIQTDKRPIKKQDEICFDLPQDKTVYGPICSDEDMALQLLLSCIFEGEDHYFLNNHYLILLGRDKQSEFFADIDTSSHPALQYDLDYGIDSINGMTPASQLLFVYPQNWYRENIVFLKDSSGITKYHVDIDTEPIMYIDSDGSPFEYFELYPETFTSEKVTENDINLDGAVNLKDVFLLRRYIAGGWDIELKEIQKEMADLNGDEKIDLKDVVLLRRYIAGGWD